MNKPSYGVIVGRFQCHELHDGHMELFRIVRGRHSRVIVFLGCNRVGPTRHDPLDFEVRKRMIQAKFPEFTVLPLRDKKTDEEWSRELDSRISDAVGEVPAEVVFYGSRDSFAPYYHGTHPVRELEIFNVPKAVSSTEVRATLTNTVMESADFRAGAIYAMGQLWPRVVTVVDIAIVHDCRLGLGSDAPGAGLMLLVGKKPDDILWRFPGGHALFTTDSFEADAKKEAFEETGLDVDSLEYIGSRRVDSWRWKGEPSEGYKTLFFVAESMAMGGHGSDDLSETKWFRIDDLAEEDFEKEHRPLFRMLLGHVTSKWGYSLRKKEEEHATAVEG